MNLPFCGCGQPLWTRDCVARGYCEHCRLHHSTHWPAYGHHPRVFPYHLPDNPYTNPYRKADATAAGGLNLMRNPNGDTVIHRHTCTLLEGKQVPWLWANTVETAEILYAAAYFGYATCRECHPLAAYDSTVV